MIVSTGTFLEDYRVLLSLIPFVPHWDRRIFFANRAAEVKSVKAAKFPEPPFLIFMRKSEQKPLGVFLLNP
ncbi:MAG: hypothetical protein IPN90_09690 [Elusimicrobia bacterium]|nr:hypothetical protein [Elusimicrobiota bacterium]